MNTPFVSPERESHEEFSSLLKMELGPGSLKALPQDLRMQTLYLVRAAPDSQPGYLRKLLPLLAALVLSAVPLFWGLLQVSRELNIQPQRWFAPLLECLHRSLQLTGAELPGNGIGFCHLAAVLPLMLVLMLVWSLRREA